MLHAAQREAAEVRRRVEVGDERLERVALLVGRRGDVVEQQLEERLEVAALRVRVERRPTGARVRVDDREVDLRLVRVEVEEELVDLVDDLLDARVGPVHLVHDEDDGQARLERLAQHEPGLGERSLARVDEQEHAVDHRQAPLDLAAEVRVARGVDDVDLHPAVAHRDVLGEDRDALLALEVVRVEDPVVDLLVVPERARLPEHGVDQGGLAVVDVGDNCHVSEIISLGARGHEPSLEPGPFQPCAAGVQREPNILAGWRGFLVLGGRLGGRRGWPPGAGACWPR